jgi:predicted  nucleic acid-binding Zn-ribbon protein
MSQHVTTLKDYSRQLSELDTRQQSLMKDLRDAKDTLEKESQEILNAAIPEITEQTKTMESVENRVETARTKLAHQVDTVFIQGSKLIVAGGYRFQDC